MAAHPARRTRHFWQFRFFCFSIHRYAAAPQSISLHVSHRWQVVESEFFSICVNRKCYSDAWPLSDLRPGFQRFALLACRITVLEAGRVEFDGRVALQ